MREPPLLPLPLPSRKVTCNQRECSTQHVATAPVLGDPLYSSNHHLSHIPGVGVQRGLYLHSSHVSFYVSTHRLPSTSRHPFTSSPLPIPTGIDLPRPSIASYMPSIRSSHTKLFHFRPQSYRQTGNRKRFRIGVTAPLPPYFVQACQKLRLPLTDELINGGVRIDDVPQDLSFLREGEGTDNGMRWLL